MAKVMVGAWKAAAEPARRAKAGANFMVVYTTVVVGVVGETMLLLLAVERWELWGGDGTSQTMVCRMTLAM